MEELSVKWEYLCASSRLLRFVAINLRGVGQVMFQNNPLTGRSFWPELAGDRTQPVRHAWR
jgi:urea transporter